MTQKYSAQGVRLVGGRHTGSSGIGAATGTTEERNGAFSI